MEVHDIVQEVVYKTITKKKMCKMAKIVVLGGLTNSCEKKKKEKQKGKEKRKDIPI